MGSDVASCASQLVPGRVRCREPEQTVGRVPRTRPAQGGLGGFGVVLLEAVGDQLGGGAVQGGVEHAHEGGWGDENGAAELVVAAAHVKLLGQHLGKGPCGVLLGWGGLFPGTVAAACICPARSEARSAFFMRLSG